MWQRLAVLSIAVASVLASQPKPFSGLASLKNATYKNITLQGRDVPLPHKQGGFRIVGGGAASPGQICYTAFLYLKSISGKSWLCTGTLISPTFILTAGHCTQSADGGGLAMLGAVSYDDMLKSPYAQWRFLKSWSVKTHKGYNSADFHNDVGLVEVTFPFFYNKYVCPMKLPAASKPVSASEICTVSGWGKTADSQSSDKLMYTNVLIEKQDECANFYKTTANYPVSDSQVCTSGAGGKSTCNGDSGGPLVQDDELIGITSLGLPSCESGAPSVYTRVSSFVDWIKQNANI